MYTLLTFRIVYIIQILFLGCIYFFTILICKYKLNDMFLNLSLKHIKKIKFFFLGV